MANHQCKECGNTFMSRQYNADFCTDGCRKTFNNRRAKRGAVLYDLLMIEACDPEALKRNKLDGRAKELVARFKQEDEQANRKRSWKRSNEVMYDTVELLR